MANFKRTVQYVEVANKIRNRLRSGEFQPGTPVMSSREMAKTYNVSVKTVRNAIKMLVKENLLSSVQGGGTYIQDSIVNSGELKIGCVINCQLDSTDFTQRIKNSCSSAIDYFAKHKCSVRHIPPLAVYNNTELNEYTGNLDGLLVSAIDVNIQNCMNLYELSIPVVVFMSEFELRRTFSQVLPDHFRAIYQAFKRLKFSEYSKLVIVYNDYSNHIARRDAFAACARELGLSDNHLVFHESPVGETYKSGLEISKMPGKKLICTTSGTLTIPIYNALGDKSKKLGHDFEMIGYDSLEGVQTRFGSSAAITTIDYSHSRASIMAAKLLIKEIREQSDYRQIIKLPTELTVGTGRMQLDNI